MKKKRTKRVTNKTEDTPKKNIPEELYYLLVIVNLIPNDLKLPDSARVLSNEFEKNNGRSMNFNDLGLYGNPESSEYKENVCSTWEIISDILKESPKFLGFLMSFGNGDDDTSEGRVKNARVRIELYEEFLSWKEKIFIVASNCMASSAKDSKFNGSPDLDFSQHSSTELLIKDGLVDYKFDLFITFTQGIEARRLRICENCQRVYWAFRLDARTCSNKCSSTRRQRNYRKAMEAE